MAVIITDVGMQYACCACVNGERAYCKFYSACKHRNTIKVNYKPSDCPLKSAYELINEIVKRMWNCRGKHCISIDKVKMEMIIKEIFNKYCDKEQSNEQTTS